MRTAKPAYVLCVHVGAANGVSFDRPTKAVFSPDGATAYVLDCGPECGGTAAGITTIPITGSSLNPSGVGASGIALLATSNIAVPGGATNGVFRRNHLYVAGQQVQSDGLLAGNLSLVDGQPKGAAQYSISDGTHNKMILADNDTLWIGPISASRVSDMDRQHG